MSIVINLYDDFVVLEFVWQCHIGLEFNMIDVHMNCFHVMLVICLLL